MIKPKVSHSTMIFTMLKSKPK